MKKYFYFLVLLILFFPVVCFGKITLSGTNGGIHSCIVQATIQVSLGAIGTAIYNITHTSTIDFDETCECKNVIYVGSGIDIAFGKTITANNNLLDIAKVSITGSGTWVDTSCQYSAAPLFTDAAGDDFTLKPGSPCCKAGVYISGYTTKPSWVCDDITDCDYWIENYLTIGVYPCPFGAAGM